MLRATGCQDGRADRRADSPPDLGGARRVRAEDGYGIQEGSECSEPGWLQDPNSPSLILGGGGGSYDVGKSVFMSRFLQVKNRRL